MIKLSDNALLRLRELKQKHNKKYVRLDVKGGGCAGFNYEWSFADEETRNDAVVDDVLVVSRDYELYLMGLELDYTYDDFESMFKFNNPKSDFIAVDLPAPLGPSIATISPLSAFKVHELIISGPSPYPAVILFPSKNAIIF